MSNFEPKIPIDKTATADTNTESGSTVPEFTTTTEEDVLKQRIRDIEAGLAVLKGQYGEVKLKSTPAKLPPIDWNRVKESDVFNFDVPIPVVDHDLPDYLTINLKDSNFVARWVNKSPRRLGPMLAVGWTFITLEDLDTKIPLDIKPDVDGVYRFDDVIAMKHTKAYLYGVYRKNHIRALNMVDPKAAHEAGKKLVERELSDSTATGTNHGDYERYRQTGKIEVYAPGFQI